MRTIFVSPKNWTKYFINRAFKGLRTGDFIILKPNEFLDVRFYCDKTRRYEEPNTNIEHVLKFSDRMKWGYRGQGPHDFSRSILYHFSKENVEFAKKYQSDFVVDVIQHLPHDRCGVLKAQVILDWIAPRLSGEIPSRYAK